MTVKEIIKEYLLKNNYDGLCSDRQCYCDIKNLISCEVSIEFCQPAHKIKENNGIICYQTDKNNE